MAGAALADPKAVTGDACQFASKIALEAPRPDMAKWKKELGR